MKCDRAQPEVLSCLPADVPFAPLSVALKHSKCTRAIQTGSNIKK